MAIVYRMLTEDDTDDVIEILLKEFFPLDIFVQCLSPSKDELRAYARILSKVILPMGLSIGAFDESSNKMYGVSLNTNSSYSHADFPHFPKLDNISRFEDWSEPTIVKELGTKNILFSDLVVVCYDQLHLGIGKEFLIRCHQLARERDFDTIVGMSITDNSARIASKYGWKCFKKIDLRSYRDSYTGEAVFAKATMPFVSVMHKDLRNINPKSKL